MGARCRATQLLVRGGGNIGVPRGEGEPEMLGREAQRIWEPHGSGQPKSFGYSMVRRAPGNRGYLGMSLSIC